MTTQRDVFLQEKVKPPNLLHKARNLFFVLFYLVEFISQSMVSLFSRENKHKVPMNEGQ